MWSSSEHLIIHTLGQEILMETNYKCMLLVTEIHCLPLSSLSVGCLIRNLVVANQYNTVRVSQDEVTFDIAGNLTGGGCIGVV